MNAGFAYLIQSKELYQKNRDKIINLIECSEGIYNASIIEYNSDLYLIIDGHSSILEVTVYEDEEFGPQETFSYSLAKLIYPSFVDNAQELIAKSNFQKSLMQLEFLKMDKDFDFDFLCKSMSKDNPNMNKSFFDLLEKNIGKVIMKREELFYGLLYGEINDELSLLFNTPIEELKALSDAIFKSTSEKASVSPVTFIETLFDMLD